MIDYHIHTNHSIDAKGNIDEYCKRALELKLDEICFTNHCELDPERNDNLICIKEHTLPFARENLLQLYNEVNSARNKFKESGLSVKFGIEVGYFEGIEERLKAVTRGINIDFLLGSIHCLDHVCIDSSKEYEGYFEIYNVTQLLTKYYEAVEKLIKSDLFDSLGHLDVYKKYGIAYYGDPIHAFPEEQVRHIFNLMKEKSLCLEINTAGIRRINEFYPAPALMRCAQECGLKRVTIGSDSHRPEDLGKGLSEAISYAKEYDFEVICAFQNRQVMEHRL